MLRALEKDDVNVAGLTLSENQRSHVDRLSNDRVIPRSKRVLLQRWEESDERVDRIASIGAFEHFGFDRYDDFVHCAFDALPADGATLLHTITSLTVPQVIERGIPVRVGVARFVKFIATKIFPRGRLPAAEVVETRAADVGFSLTRRQPLHRRYVRT